MIKLLFSYIFRQVFLKNIPGKSTSKNPNRNKWIHAKGYILCLFNLPLITLFSNTLSEHFCITCQIAGSQFFVPNR